MKKKSLIFAGLFGFVSVLTFMILGGFVSADDSVIIESSNSSYSSNEVGAWKIKEEAKWVQKGKAQLTLTANSVSFDDGSARDVVYVAEASNSMSYIYPFVQAAMEDAAEDILADSNNTVSLITFNGTARIEQGMTNNLATIKSAIHNSSYQGPASYYAAFTKLEELLSTYNAQPGRKLIVVFIADGPPSMQSPLEVAEYRQIKASFPDIVINGVQVDYDNVINEFKAVTDNQIIWGKDAPDGIYKQFIVEATRINYNYDTFRVQSTIDTDKFTIDGAESTNGVVTTGSNAISWNMDDAYRSGTEAKLTIDLSLKDSYLSGSLNDFYPIKKTIVSTGIMDVPAENKEITSSPRIALRHSVSYQLNGPSGCSLNNIPATTNEITFDAVKISDNVPVCNGYTFKYWVIANDGVERLNDDYFVMPYENVVLKAIWHKISIDKEVDGTVIGSDMAVLEYGYGINSKIMTMAGTTGVGVNEHNETIKKIRMSDTLPRDFTPNTDNTVSDSTSAFPIYMWVSGDTLYFYTNAEGIYMNSNISGMFQDMYSLEDISGISSWITSKVSQARYTFSRDRNLTDISALANWNTAGLYDITGLFQVCESLSDISPIANWDTSNFSNISQAFSGMDSLTNISALANWDVSKVRNMSYLFQGTEQLSNLSPLTSWVTTSVENMEGVFNGADSVADISPLAGWNTAKVTNMKHMFSYTAITNVNALRRWNTAKVTNMTQMFEYCTQLTDISTLYYFNVANVTSMNSMFYHDSSLSNFTPIRYWNVSKVEDFGAMFAENPLITNVDFLANWNTAAATQTAMMLYDDTALTDISGLTNWKMSGVTRMKYMFFNDYNITSLAPLNNWTVNTSADMTGIFNDIPASITRPTWYN